MFLDRDNALSSGEDVLPDVGNVLSAGDGVVIFDVCSVSENWVLYFGMLTADNSRYVNPMVRGI